MSLFTTGIIGVAFCFLLIFLRMPVAFAFGLSGFLGIWVVRGLGPALNTIGTVPYTTASMYVWTVVPLFVFMGFLALHSGLAQEFYSGVRRWVGHFRGGLALAVIVGNTGFGACTGDSVSAAITFTAMSLPEMRKFGYSDRLTLGSVSAGSLLAGLIPPSMGFIIYGAITETSIGQLFIAGIFPGLILAAFYIAVIYFWCRRNPQLGPPAPRATWSERWRGGIGMWSLLVVFVVIIGGIFAGLFTPTEAGAAGAFVILVIALARRRLNWQSFKAAFRDSAVTIGMVGFLLIGTLTFNTFLVVTGVPATIATFISGITGSAIGTVWIVIATCFILGMFIDPLSLLLIMAPILYPVAINAGIDPIHFGVILSMILMTGGLTPPFGIIVYAVSGTVKDVPLFDIFKGVAPFLIAMMVSITLVVFIPQISLFLPDLMMK
jgi:tripartite ATP-independent transporter DctM subunit